MEDSFERAQSLTHVWSSTWLRENRPPKGLLLKGAAPPTSLGRHERISRVSILATVFSSLAKRKTAAIVCWMATAIPAIGQQPLQTLLVGVDHRSVTSLDGDWHYLVDQAPARDLYTDKGDINDRGYAMNSHPNISSGPHNEEYDFATAPTLKVPGDWNTQVAQLFNYEGVLWYERDFDARPKPGMRTFLHVGAANYRSHVWGNQKRVCDH